MHRYPPGKGRGASVAPPPSCSANGNYQLSRSCSSGRMLKSLPANGHNADLEVIHRTVNPSRAHAHYSLYSLLFTYLIVFLRGIGVIPQGHRFSLNLIPSGIPPYPLRNICMYLQLFLRGIGSNNPLTKRAANATPKLVDLCTTAIYTNTCWAYTFPHAYG